MQLRTIGGNVVAHVNEYGILIKKVREYKHKLRAPKGWAFDTTVINEAREYGAHTIRIEAGDTGNTYTTSMSTFIKNAFPINRTTPQLVLVDKFWNNGEPEPIQLTFL